MMNDIILTLLQSQGTLDIALKQWKDTAYIVNQTFIIYGTEFQYYVLFLLGAIVRCWWFDPLTHSSAT